MGTSSTSASQVVGCEPVGLPVRTEPRVADAEALDRANDGREGRARYLPFSEELPAIKALESVRVNPEDAERWTTHPDERVPCAFLKVLQLQMGPTARVPAFLYHRATTEAKTEGVHWTPLLDALSTSHVWPVFPTDILVDGEHLQVEPLNPASFLLDLRPHLALLGDVDEWLRVGRAFSSKDIRRCAAAAHTRVRLDEEMMEVWFEDPLTWHELLQNPYLEAEARRWMERKAAERLREGQSWNERSAAIAALQGIRSREGSLGAEARGALTLFLRRASEEALPPLELMNANIAHATLCEMASWTPEEYRALREYAAVRSHKDTSALKRIAESEAAGVHVWNQLLDAHRGVDVRRAIAAHAPARLDPAIRERLSKGKDPVVLESLASDGASDLGRLLVRLLRLGHDGVSADVLDALPAGHAPIEPRHLRVLLASDSSRLRLAAIRAAGAAGAHQREPQASPKKTERRR